MGLATGDKAPTFSGLDQTGAVRTSADFIGHRIVIYFYPKSFTPGCTAESCDFRDRHELFVENGFRILGISPDEPSELARFKTEYDLPFDLISDPNHSIATAFGAYGLKKNYGREYMGIIRSTFLISATGRIDEAYYNVRAKGHAERISKAVESE